MKFNKILSLILVALMLVSTLTIIPVTASAATDIYTGAANGDLLYTVNYGGDDNYKPYEFQYRMGVEVGADPTSVTLTNVEGANAQNWWGGRIENLPLNTDTQYTIYYTIARPAGVNTSLGLCIDGSFEYYFYTHQGHWQRWSGANTTIGAYQHPYIQFANVKNANNEAFDASGDAFQNPSTADSVQYLAVEVNGANNTYAAYMKDTTGKWFMVDKSVAGEHSTFHDDCLNISFYNYTYGRAVTISETKIYKGLLLGECDTTPTPDLNSIAISDAAGIAAIETGKNYHLTQDIDLGGMVLSQPLIAEYSGTIDGKGFSIFNFKIDVPDANAADFGLFQLIGKTADTTIKNLNLGKADAKIEAKIGLGVDSKSIGFLIGAMNNNYVQGLIENVHIYADMTVPTTYKCNVGGFCGYSRDLIIRDSSMNGSIIAGATGKTSYVNVGGFLGSGANVGGSVIENSVNNADISVYDSTVEARAAGFVPYAANYIRIEDCVNNGKIALIPLADDTTSNAYIGGIVGMTNMAGVTVDGCVNNGEILCETDSFTAFCSPILACGVFAVRVINCENKAAYSDAHYSGAYVGGFESSAERYSTIEGNKTSFTPVVPEAVAINTAEDFAAMAPDGNYFINADITLAATYDKVFFGTIDGKGHTVTIAAPMFADFSGTISDLTIAGADIVTDKDTGALAVTTTGGFTAVNLVNKVNIQITGTGTAAGGFVAAADTGFNTAVFRNCINEGNIEILTAETPATETAAAAPIDTRAGGFMGIASGFDAKFCTNKGNISAPSKKGQAGGFVALAVSVASYVGFNADDCTNDGNVTSAYDAAGIVGCVGVSSNNVRYPFTFYYTTNNGTITGGYRAGGILGYSYGSGSNEYFEIRYCVLNGDVYAGRPAADGLTYASLFAGYSNTIKNSIQYSVANGEIIALTGEAYNTVADTTLLNVIVGCSSAKTPLMDFHDNYLCDNDTVKWYTWASASGNAAQRIEIATAIAEGKITKATAAEIADGSIKDKINAAAGAEVLAQAATDATPVINAALRAERMKSDSVYSLFIEEEPVDPPYTADNTVYAIVAVAAIAVAVMAIFGMSYRRRITD